MIKKATLSLIATMALGANLYANNCEVKLTTSAYINWNAINASQSAGLYKEVEKQHKCKLTIDYQPDYLNSLALFSTNKADAVTVTNLDQMTALSSVPSVAVVLQDYSNGNDGLVSRKGKTLSDIKGQEIWMVTKSISEQLFVVAAQKEGLDPYKDFQIKHMDLDSNLRSGYMSGQIDNVVTWNPALDAIAQSGNTVVTSANFAGHIVDMIVLNKETKEFDKKAKFLRALWDKTAKVINGGRGDEYNSLLTSLVDETGGSIGEVKTMLKGSKIFTPKEELKFYKSELSVLQEKTFSIASQNGFFEGGEATYRLDGKMGGDTKGTPSVFFSIQ
jgi:NitT/TauT family transport system substrate-binding protein